MKECLEPKQLRQKTDQSKTNQEFSYSNTWQPRLASVSPSGRWRKRRLPLLSRRGRHSHPHRVYLTTFSVYVSPRTSPCTFPHALLRVRFPVRHYARVKDNHCRRPHSRQDVDCGPARPVTETHQRCHKTNDMDTIMPQRTLRIHAHSHAAAIHTHVSSTFDASRWDRRSSDIRVVLQSPLRRYFRL